MNKIQISHSLNAENNKQYFKVLFQNGFRAILKSPVRLTVSILYWLSALALLSEVSAPKFNLIDRLFQPLLCISVPVLAILFFAVGVTVSAMPAGALRTAYAFRRANITNSAGEPPLLTRRFQQDGKTIIEVFTQGVTAAQFQDRLEAVESALGARVTKIEQGQSNQYLLLHLAPGDAKLPDRIPLPDIQPDDSSVILLGESLDGSVSVALDKQPHILAGGSTGSGKTQLIISMISQLLRKTDSRGNPAVEVYIADLKGGMDYPPSFQKRCCSFATTGEDTLSILSQITGELERRKLVFADARRNMGTTVSNLSDFNRLYPDNSLRRIVFVVDEIADLTDTTGMGKPHKELAAAIVSKLSAIARQGRAFGINLIISTQRPDVLAVPGVVRSNINARVAGKCDNVLSQIILDNTSASDLIPKDSQGMFVNQDGIVFRGYLFDASQGQEEVLA